METAVSNLEVLRMSVSGTKRHGPLVLVVDDLPDVRAICSEYLSFRGVEVAAAEDGLAGLARAFELHPDVILMDLSMPGLGGLEATGRLKRDRRTRDIPVIALTAHALPYGSTTGADQISSWALLRRSVQEGKNLVR